MANTVTVDISGPDYHKSAVELASNLSVKSISELRILPGASTTQLDSLLPAVQYLRNYFHPSGQIVILTPGISGEMIGQLKAASGVNVVVAAVLPFGGMMMMNQLDTANAQSIMSQMQADNQKQQMERWKILQDTQTKIFEIQQDVTANKAQTQDKAYKRWDEYIRG